MTDSFPKTVSASKPNDNVVSLSECANIEARLEAAVAANPHCPKNIFLRRRAIVLAQGPSKGPEALVVLRSSIWPRKPHGPLIAYQQLAHGRNGTRGVCAVVACKIHLDGPSEWNALLNLRTAILQKWTSTFDVRFTQDNSGSKFDWLARYVGEFEGDVIDRKSSQLLGANLLSYFHKETLGVPNAAQ